ncbi:MAG: FCD domain-containing protein, partial [Anaerolineaceae bacterium]|nr:FCD domain-containing protein [Anaerolineaceae bacterium]
GWIEIQHGKPTRVRDFWIEGNLGVTAALAQYQNPLPPDFIDNLFSVRVLLAPTYTRVAVLNAPNKVVDYLSSAQDLEEKPEIFSSFDWELHWRLTLYAHNSIFTHFMNSVRRLYEIIGIPYFSYPKTRRHSRKFYLRLRELAAEGNSKAAEELTQQVMSESAALWDEIVKHKE